jgi:hypothetical protein
VHLDLGVLTARAAGGDLDVRADADAELLHVAALATRGLVGAQVVVTCDPQRLAEGGVVVADVVGDTGDGRVRELVGAQEVATANRGRVHAELHGSQIEDALEHGGRLRASRAAVRAHRCRVGERDRAVVADARDPVHALRHHPRRTERQHPAEAAVRARIADDATSQSDDRPVVAQAELQVLHLAATVRHGDHVLGPRLDPLHRTAQLARDAHRDDALGHPVLRTERAADVRCDQPHVLRLDAERVGECAAVRVRHLARQVERELVTVAVVARHDGHRRALHRHDRQTLVLEAAPHDDLGTGERVEVVRLAGTHDDVGTDRVELQRRVGRERVLHVDDRRERVVVDDHRVDRVDGLRLALGHDHRDRISHEPNPAARECGAHHLGMQLHHSDVVGELEIVSRVHRDDARHRERGAGVDGRDLGVGDR